MGKYGKLQEAIRPTCDRSFVKHTTASEKKHSKTPFSSDGWSSRGKPNRETVTLYKRWSVE
ncbi:hypothetical protein E2C01_023924 [Portunus trituberculatus]|uniref:Uncharacterized protein n=1 Tax=Portunus trituberculatus TaxID=210409 RepID=A0A5B7EBU4_PORTR|nr:hypothetical protein [Portunus trituberculatus]